MPPNSPEGLTLSKTVLSRGQNVTHEPGSCDTADKGRVVNDTCVRNTCDLGNV